MRWKRKFGELRPRRNTRIGGKSPWWVHALGIGSIVVLAAGVALFFIDVAGDDGDGDSGATLKVSTELDTASLPEPYSSIDPENPNRNGDDEADDDTEPASGNLANTVIVLDPGHNGGNADSPDKAARTVKVDGVERQCDTAGTSNDAFNESAFNLQFAKELKAELEGAGAIVRMTRTGDAGVGPCITKRLKVGNNADVDVVISIHADGTGDNGQRGFHVIYPADVETTATIAKRSRKLAELLRDRIDADTELPFANYLGDQGLDSRQDLSSLNGSTVPKVILEVGNPDNAEDRELMTDDDDMRRLASAVLSATTTWAASVSAEAAAEADDDK